MVYKKEFKNFNGTFGITHYSFKVYKLSYDFSKDVINYFQWNWLIGMMYRYNWSFKRQQLNYDW